MNVEYTVLQRGFALHQEEYEQAALRTLRSGRYILSEELSAFEKEFADYLGAKHCIGVGNGTDALILAFRALGIGPGDEVIVPAGTYIASVMGVTENGATPVFVDSDEYLVMDADSIEEKITERTKAILPVHLYGQACDMGKIMDIAARHHLYVVEDCAQSHGAVFQNQKTGTFGIISCFSFYPTKPLGAFGDAGALVTNDDVLWERLVMLRNYGSRTKYHNEIQGVNSRLDELQAALLRVGLHHLEEENAMRLQVAGRYSQGIHNPMVQLPIVRQGASHVFHLFPVLCQDRDGLQRFLLGRGVKTQIHYPIPPYVAECNAAWGYNWGDFPQAASIARLELSLPIYAGMPPEEVDYVVDAVNSFSGGGQ